MSKHNKPQYYGNNNTTIERKLSIEARPIPSPDELAKYEAIKPGITNIILNTYEKQVEHRIEIEKLVIKQKTDSAKIGQTYAFIITLVVIVAGFILILFNKDIIGIVTVIGALVSLVSVFITGREKERKERVEKFNSVK